MTAVSLLSEDGALLGWLYLLNVSNAISQLLQQYEKVLEFKPHENHNY